MAWTERIAHWYRKYVVGREVADVAGETQAYLSGTYRQLLERRREPVPAWAWVNGLAHGGHDEVARLASAACGDGPEDFVAGLARDLLGQLAARRAGLEELQRERLIPLELALASDPMQVFPRTGAHLARTVHTALKRGVSPIDPARHGSGGKAPPDPR